MDLISKKELLAQTGISYGQLYRWKRARLIPEEWFIKQSAYTGQETFFPREEILRRIRVILRAKDQYSLEELAHMLTPESAPELFPASVLERMEEINGELLPSIAQACPKEAYSLAEVTLFAAVSEIAWNLSLSQEQVQELLGKAVETLPSLKSTDVSCVVFSTDGNIHLAFSRGAAPIQFDGSVQVLDVRPLGELSNQLKLRYQHMPTI